MEPSSLASLREQLNTLEGYSVRCVVMTRPRSLSNEDFAAIGEDLFRLAPKDGVVWCWGKIDELDRAGWAICPGQYDNNLWVGFTEPRALPPIPPPRIEDHFAREMPPAVIDHAITTSTNRGDFVLDIFNRSGVASAVCQGTGRRCVALGSTMNSDIVIPPSGGWPGRDELTDPDVIRRFEANLMPYDGHLLWSRATTKKGYGNFKIRGKNQYAHRYAWERVFGPIVVPGIDVSHSCGLRRCCHVDHLRIADHLHNLAERHIRDRYREAQDPQI